jgi:hypothetical protein
MNINDIEPKKVLAGEMGKAICNLANIAEDWNDAQEEPDERGPGNSAVGMIVFDDGSGYIAEFQHPVMDNEPLSNAAIIKEFKSPEEAEDWFIDNISLRSL